MDSGRTSPSTAGAYPKGCEPLSKAVRKAYEEILSGTVSNTQEIVVPMVALRMIESWLLSDSKAFEKVYGKDPFVKKKINLPPRPETLWGKETNPKSTYPKNVFVDICKSLNHEQEPTREDYALLAENIDIHTLQDKCPISFGRFVVDFENALKTKNLS